MTIIDGRAYWVCSLEDWAAKPQLADLVKARNFNLYKPSVVAEDADPAPVYINHGRLFARCWARGCGGAELVWLDNPKIWCTSCGNAELNGYWRPVAMPGDDTLATVDHILRVRAEHERNWAGTAESIQALIEENARNGLGAPEREAVPQ